jgi:hypothetical protein
MEKLLSANKDRLELLTSTLDFFIAPYSNKFSIHERKKAFTNILYWQK